MDNPTIPAPAAPVTTPSSTAAPTVTPAVELHSHSGLSITEAVTMAAWTREDLAK